MVARISGRRVGTTVLDPEVERIIAERLDSDYLQRERPSLTSLHERIADDCRAIGKSPPALVTLKRRVDAFIDLRSIVSGTRVSGCVALVGVCISSYNYNSTSHTPHNLRI